MGQISYDFHYSLYFILKSSRLARDVIFLRRGEGGRKAIKSYGPLMLYELKASSAERWNFVQIASSGDLLSSENSLQSFKSCDESIMQNGP